MTIKSIFLISFVLLLGVVISCGDKVERPAPILTDEEIQANQSQFQAPTIPSGGVVGGVRHYTCPNGHDGSDSQGACITCGATLVHNQAFHDQAQTPASTPPGEEPPQNAVGVWHYTCPNGHDGGSGSATTCPECGATLAHNTEYHGTPGAATTPTTPLSTTTSTPPAPEPAQNAAGVWHYTCPSGHAGGAGSATACPECGATLVHNQIYHN